MVPSILIEIAAFTPTAAINAAKAGAHRVELCSGYSEGGLSPSVGTVKLVRENISIPLHVMVRPRIGDFIYSDIEKECILSEIAFYKTIGVNGIVVGALSPEGKVDKEFVAAIVRLASPMSVTFHRAFDISKDIFEALDDLIELGVHRVLTSGARPNVREGLDTISKLVKQSQGRIIVLPGGGVNSENIEELIRKTGVTEIHMSSKTLVKTPLKYEPTISLSSPYQTSDGKWYEFDSDGFASILRTINGI